MSPPSAVLSDTCPSVAAAVLPVVDTDLSPTTGPRDVRPSHPFPLCTSPPVVLGGGKVISLSLLPTPTFPTLRDLSIPTPRTPPSGDTRVLAARTLLALCALFSGRLAFLFAFSLLFLLPFDGLAFAADCRPRPFSPLLMYAITLRILGLVATVGVLSGVRAPDPPASSSVLLSAARFCCLGVRRAWGDPSVWSAVATFSLLLGV